jgi:hypothetical protein
MVVNLPEERLEDFPECITRKELSEAFKSAQAKQRLADSETEAPGMDRSEILLLAVGLGLADLDTGSGPSGPSPNARYHKTPETFGPYRR